MSSINAAFKYDHDDSAGVTWPQLITGFGGLASIVLLFLTFPFLGFFAVMAWVILLARVWPKRKICLYPRYFICGDTIIYYRRVNRLTKTDGMLRISWGTQKSFVLMRERFPTNARKPEKIAANKSTKFDRVAGKIIEKVLSVKPDVELDGIDRPADGPQEPQ